MLSLQLFNCFTEDLAEQLTKLDDGVSFALTNVAPNVTDREIADLANVVATGAFSIVSSSQANGTYRLILNDLTYVADEAIGYIRYIVLTGWPYSTLIGWYDYGSSININQGDSFHFNFDQVNGAIVISTEVQNYMSADQGNYALSGSDVGLTFPPRLVAEKGTYTLAGINATIFPTYVGDDVPIISSVISSNTTDEGFKITATVNPNGSSTAITIEYGRTFNYEYSATFPSSPISETSTVDITLTGLGSNKDCNWRVKAVNNVGPTYSTGTTKTNDWRTTDSTGDPDYYSAGITFYIDPTVPTSGNGSIGSPWKAWSNIVWANNRIYLFKRGTTLTATNFQRLAGVSNITFAGYGTGARPILNGTTTSSSAKILDFGGINTNLKISGLEVRQAGSPVSVLMNFASSNTNLIIEYCYLHNGGTGIHFYDNNSIYYEGSYIRNCVIEDIQSDGYYAHFCNTNHLINTRILRVNQLWEPPETDDAIANGDGVQFVGVYDYLIRDCYIDRSDTGNKFGFIQNSPGNGIIEWSEIVSPINTAEGGATTYCEHGNVLTMRDCLIRGNSSNPATSRHGMYHNNAGYTFTSQRNIYRNLPIGIYNLQGTATSEDDVFENCTTNTYNVTFL